MLNGVTVDTDDLRQRAMAFSERMYGEDDPRRVQCADRFFNEEYFRMVTPPYEAPIQRIERLITEIRDLLETY